MPIEIEPMIKLDPNPKSVPVLSYNVPEPTSYTGRNLIELDFLPPDASLKDYFKADLFKNTSEAQDQEIANLRLQDSASIKQRLLADFKTDISTSIFVNSRLSTPLRLKDLADGGSDMSSQLKTLPTLQGLSVDDVANQLKNGYQLKLSKNLYGDLIHQFLPIPQKKVIRPRLVLIETCGLSSFLGNYGAGRTIKTFSLLPGEKTKISIKTYLKTEKTSKDASSILDSFTSESATDFQDSMSSENSQKDNSAESFEYHAEAEAQASWGWGSAKVSGGVKGGSNSSREEFAKNTQSATSKHANKASAKRDVQINTSTEVKEQAGEDTETIREIENINVSRTLNFVFRQMNQEFITLLHLKDIRIGFYNGDDNARREYTLHELDALLDTYIIEAKRAEVKKVILNQLLHITDYQEKTPVSFNEDGSPANLAFVQQKHRLDDNDQPVEHYYQFAKDLYSKYTDASGREILVQGILLSATKNVMRTEGVIVDSILGQGDALDAYSHRLREASAREKELANALKEAELEKNTLFNTLVNNNQIEQAKLVLETIENKNSKNCHCLNLTTADNTKPPVK